MSITGRYRVIDKTIGTTGTFNRGLAPLTFYDALLFGIVMGHPESLDIQSLYLFPHISLTIL